MLQRDDEGSPRAATDWRIASFSVILPVPRGTLTEQYPAHRVDNYLNPAGLWVPGRYAGVRGFEHRPGANASYAHHTHATRRFRPSVNASIASSLIDLDETATLDDDAWTGPAMYHHVDFEPEFGSGSRDECATCSPGPVPGRAPLFEYALSPDGISLSPGTLQLRAVELAQFADRLDATHTVSSAFLILHLVGQNLSSAELEAISRALSRPRNMIRGRAPRTPNDDSIDYRVPLTTAVTEAKRLLKEGGIGSEFSLAKGGYLKGGAEQRSASAERPTRPRRSARPMRVTCAIPWPDASPPAAPEEFADDEDSTWSVFDQWGWALSTGADRFYEAIPSRTADTRDVQRLGDHEYWSLWGTSYGISVVRKPGGNWIDAKQESVFMKDPSLWMLASTRFVDLCLLTQRCTLALHDLESRLAIGGNELEEQLDSFNVLQSHFLAFRNQLWFDVVSDHMLDTLVLARLRQQTGQLSMYADLRDEVEIRREIYDTRHAIQTVRDQKLRADRAAEEQKDREDRRDERESDRIAAEQSREKLNVAIGIAAAILAVPAVAETTGITPSWGYFAGVLAIMVLLSVGVVVFVRVRGKRRREGQFAQEPSTPRTNNDNAG